jgi:hypothetical protein
VFAEFLLACALAAAPTTLPSLVKATHEGMVRPEAVGITSTFPSIQHAKQEYVVPKSIPMIGVGLAGSVVGAVSVIVKESVGCIVQPRIVDYSVTV